MDSLVFQQSREVLRRGLHFCVQQWYLVISQAKTLSVLQHRSLSVCGSALARLQTTVVRAWVFHNAHSTSYFQDRLLVQTPLVYSSEVTQINFNFLFPALGMASGGRAGSLVPRPIFRQGRRARAKNLVSGARDETSGRAV